MENMQTVCEGLHVNCNVDDSDNMAIICLVNDLMLKLTWDLFPLGCVLFFLKSVFYPLQTHLNA